MKIGWVFNAHGAGHRNRLQALLPHFSEQTQLTTLSYADTPLAKAGSSMAHVALPRYNKPARYRYLRKQVWNALHGLQMNSGENAAFFSKLTTWIVDWQPDLIVVDVALEAALMARFCGIPVVYMRQHGRRWDLGHRLAYEASVGLLAPFSADMEQRDCPQWIRQKTFYSGGFCRFDTGQTRPPEAFADGECNVVVLIGSGGTNITVDAIAKAAAATPSWSWFVLGKLPQRPLGKNIRSLGHVANVYPYLCHASLVVGNAGHNTVMEIGVAQAPFLCLPAQRPFKEQICKADVLKQLDLAVVSYRWPEPSDWPTILAKAKQQNRQRWQTLLTPSAPRQAAQFIEQIAHRYTIAA